MFIMVISDKPTQPSLVAASLCDFIYHQQIIN